MKSQILRRVLVALGAAVVSLLLIEAVVVAGRWAGSATGPLVSDPLIALYLIFGPQEPYGHIAAAVAAGLSLVLAVLWSWRGGEASKRQHIGRAVALGLVVGVGVVAGAAAGWLAMTPGWRAMLSETRWWMADATPPHIDLQVPSAVVRGTTSLRIDVSDQGESRLTALMIDGIAVAPAALITLDTSSLPDGQHTVAVQAEDLSRQRNQAQATAAFRTETQWWINDRTPPQITVTVPSSVVQGEARFSIATSDQGEHRVIGMTLDGVTLPLTDAFTIDTTGLADGEHTLIVDAEDASRQRNRSQAKAVFRSDNNPPTLTVRLDPEVGTQGHSQFVYLSVSEPVRAITATLGGRPLVLDASSGAYWAVIGYDAAAEPGARMLAARAVDAFGNTGAVTATVPVTRFDFPIENTTGEDIALPPETARLLDFGVAEAAQLDGVFAPLTPDQMWQGTFSMPVQGRQTSAFAIRRSYNGGPLGSYHGGVDIAIDAGTPIPAANRGRVVLAEQLHVRGNAVIIDHGMGVYTCYYHLSQIRVQTGQVVEKGQILGLGGTTGVSTGPHLHWEMRVTGMAVDPLPWTRRQYP